MTGLPPTTIAFCSRNEVEEEMDDKVVEVEEAAEVAAAWRVDGAGGAAKICVRWAGKSAGCPRSPPVVGKIAGKAGWCGGGRW